MAKVIIDQISYDVTEGACLAEVCEQAGIPFSCNTGVCGTCQIMILKGTENLHEPNQGEKDLGMDQTRRLGCQCRIINGIVEATF